MNERKRGRSGFKLLFHRTPAGEFIIEGDGPGLRYLAERCMAVIGKTDPSGHFLFDPAMYSLSEGSLPFTLAYLDDPTDRVPRTATGKAKRA